MPSARSLGVLGVLLASPGFVIFFFFVLSGASKVAHGGGDTSGLLGSLALFGVSGVLSSGHDFDVGVSVHEQVNHNVPLGVTGDISAELEGFAGEQPEAVGNGVSALVVSGNRDIDVVEVAVGVSKRNDGDVHVGGFGQALVVEARVTDNDESRFEEPVIILIRKKDKILTSWCSG